MGTRTVFVSGVGGGFSLFDFGLTRTRQNIQIINLSDGGGRIISKSVLNQSGKRRVNFETQRSQGGCKSRINAAFS